MVQLAISLVRHAESEANAGPNVICGQNIPNKVSALGKKQAQALGMFFKKEGVKFSGAYSSTAVRTQKTAKHCFSKMECKMELFTDPQLLERDAGDFAGLSRDIYKNDETLKKSLQTDNWNFIPGYVNKGESQKQVAERMKKWIDCKVSEFGRSDKDQHIIVFTHGLAIKCLLAELLDLERSTVYQIPIDNASITQLLYQAGEIKVSMVNNTDHLTSVT
jgi:broad specificity phosphatase PhoE